jgi:hypothetical protein
MTIHEMVKYIATQLPGDIKMNAKFPYDIKTPQDKRKKKHMRDLIYNDQSVMISPDMQYFEFGNEEAEEKTPHYHILEDAKIIMYPNRGTNKTKGSQRLIDDKGKRDYGQFIFVESSAVSGGYKKIQEYRQNMTRNYDGSLRNYREGRQQPREYRKRQKVSNKNKRHYYYNKHYQYIERILLDVARGLAIEVGAKLKIGSGDDPNEKAVGYLDPKSVSVSDLPISAMFNYGFSDIDDPFGGNY